MEMEEPQSLDTGTSAEANEENRLSSNVAIGIDAFWRRIVSFFGFPRHFVTLNSAASPDPELGRQLLHNTDVRRLVIKWMYHIYERPTLIEEVGKREMDEQDPVAARRWAGVPWTEIQDWALLVGATTLNDEHFLDGMKMERMGCLDNDCTPEQALAPLLHLADVTLAATQIFPGHSSDNGKDEEGNKGEEAAEVRPNVNTRPRWVDEACYLLEKAGAAGQDLFHSPPPGAAPCSLLAGRPALHGAAPTSPDRARLRATAAGLAEVERKLDAATAAALGGRDPAAAARELALATQDEMRESAAAATPGLLRAVRAGLGGAAEALARLEGCHARRWRRAAEALCAAPPPPPAAAAAGGPGLGAAAAAAVAADRAAERAADAWAAVLGRAPAFVG